MKKLLIPLDGTSFAEQALNHELLSDFKDGVDIVLVHSLDLNQVVGPPQALLPQAFAELLEQRQGYLQSYLDRQVARLQKRGFSTARAVLETGNPVDAIVRVAHEQKVDLILLTSHARGGLARLFLGSVAEGVLRHAGLPVLIVPPTQEKSQAETTGQNAVVGELVL